jgi:hypothetical protein
MKGTRMNSFATFSGFILSFRGDFKRTKTSITCRYSVLGLIGVLALGSSVEAQTPNGNASFSDTQVGANYDYTITLNNTGSTTIETFWFAWVPGEDFLPSNPITVQAPGGWADSITHTGAGDGYAIRFDTTTTPVNPGNSMTFQFESPDTPAAVAGDSPYYPTMPVGTSFVYQGAAFTTPSQSFVVQPVPEPSALALLLAGCLWPVASRFGRLSRERIKS